jgi:nuclear pore complex protein Nup160
MLSDMSAGLLNTEDTDHFHSGVSRYLQHILALFEAAGAHSFAADFARLTLAALPQDQTGKSGDNRDHVLTSLFAAELHSAHYVPAYVALTQLRNEQLQKRSAIAWADAVLGRSSLPRLEATEAIHLLQRLPLDLHPQIARVVDDHLTNLAQKQTSLPGMPSRMWPSENSTDYMKVSYALRVRRKDYRGAISVLMDRLYLVKQSRQARNDPQAIALRNILLVLINTLSCVAPNEAYILTASRESVANSMDIDRDAEGRDMETGWKARKRTIITREGLRREYQQLLDKCSRIERGDFEFDAGTDDEEDEEALEGARGTNGVVAMEF